jgi:hypothetical protein
MYERYLEIEMNGDAERIVYEIGHLPQLVWSLLQTEQNTSSVENTRESEYR